MLDQRRSRGVPCGASGARSGVASDGTSDGASSRRTSRRRRASLAALGLCLAAAGLLALCVALPAAQGVSPGSITGTVTNVEGAALPGIYITAYDGGGNYAGNATTDGAGAYDLDDLTKGIYYRLEFQDFSGGYLMQYFNGENGLFTADVITVDPGATAANIDVTLALAGHVAGRVVNAASQGLPRISVSVYLLDDRGIWRCVNQVVTAADGTYDVGGLDTGPCRLEFSDASLTYLTQYYDDQSSIDAAGDIAVTAGATTTGIDATLLLGGNIKGKVTNGSDTGLPNIGIAAFQANGKGGWDPAADTVTASDGTYELSGLPTGYYCLMLQDFSSPAVYFTQYYNNRSTPSSADLVAVTAGATTIDVNATLAANGSIAGTVASAGLDGLPDTPLDGIAVAAYRVNDHGVRGPAIDAHTAGDGSYHFYGLEAGNYRVRFLDESGTYATECYKGAAWRPVNDVKTQSDGTYDLTGLAPGSYHLEFRDDVSRGYATQYYDNEPSLAGADAVTVDAAATTAGVDATLGIPGSDVTPPKTTTHGVDGLWHNGPVTVTLKATDVLPGLGVGLTEYRCLKSSTDRPPWLPYFAEAPLVIFAEGTTTCQYRSIDVVQNAESAKAFTVKIDTAPPAATVTVLSVKAAAATKGKTLKVKVTIADPAPSCGTARLVMTLAGAGNTALVTRTFAGEPTNRVLTLAFKLSRKLVKGRYSISATATDVAGNVQTAVGKANLTVR